MRRRPDRCRCDHQDHHDVEWDAAPGASAASRLGDDRASTDGEGTSALIAERPGKLFKLVTASGFACAALTYRVTHRKAALVHSATSRFWIGHVSALVAGALLTGETLLTSMITGAMPYPSSVIILGAIATFVTAAELLVSTHFPAGSATAAVSFALVLIVIVVLGLHPRVGWLLTLGEIIVAASVSTACAIQLGNRLQFPVMAALLTILGGPLTFSFIWMNTTSTPWYVRRFLVAALDAVFAFGFSVGVGVLLWRVLYGRQLSQSSSARVSPNAT